MGQEEGPLSPTEILSLEYESETKSDAGLVLLAQSVKIIDGGLRSFLFSFLYFTFLCLLFSIFYF